MNQKNKVNNDIKKPEPRIRPRLERINNKGQLFRSFKQVGYAYHASIGAASQFELQLPITFHGEFTAACAKHMLTNRLHLMPDSIRAHFMFRHELVKVHLTCIQGLIEI